MVIVTMVVAAVVATIAVVIPMPAIVPVAMTFPNQASGGGQQRQRTKQQ